MTPVEEVLRQLVAPQPIDPDWVSTLGEDFGDKAGAAIQELREATEVSDELWSLIPMDDRVVYLRRYILAAYREWERLRACREKGTICDGEGER